MKALTDAEAVAYAGPKKRKERGGFYPERGQIMLHYMFFMDEYVVSDHFSKVLRMVSGAHFVSNQTSFQHTDPDKTLAAEEAEDQEGRALQHRGAPFFFSSGRKL